MTCSGSESETAELPGRRDLESVPEGRRHRVGAPSSKWTLINQSPRTLPGSLWPVRFGDWVDPALKTANDPETSVGSHTWDYEGLTAPPPFCGVG